MTDLATLGLAVDSKQVKAANDDLRDFQKEARGAARSADGFSNGAQRAGTATGRLRDQLNRSTLAAKALKSAMAWMAGFAAFSAAFGLGLKSAVMRLEQIAVASRKIDKALQLNGYSFDLTSEKIKKFASELERATGRAYQEVLDVVPNLASFGFTEDVFFRAIKLADDMSAAWGGDLKQNLEGLSRALADPVKGMAMLTQRGITLTYEQKKMAKAFMDAGQGLKAQGVVFDALEEQIKGVAEAGFGGLTKAMSNARLAMEGFFERIVSQTGLSTALEYALLGVAAAFDAMTNYMDAIVGVAVSLGAALGVAFGPAILGAVWSLVAAIGTGLVGAVAALSAAMLANPLVAFAAAVTAAVVAAYYFRDEIKKAIGVDVVEIGKTAANSVIGVFVGAYNAVVNTWAMLPAAFSDLMGQAMNFAIQKVQNGVNGIIGALRAIPGLGDLGDVDLSGYMSAAGESYKAVAKVAGKAMSDALATDYISSIGGGTASSQPGKPPSATAVLPDRDFGSDPSSKKGKKASQKLSAYEKEIRALKEKTAATQEETKVIGLSTYAKERQSAVQQLLTAAQRDGAAIGKAFASAQELINASSEQLTPALAKQRDEILNVAGAYAKAQADAEKAKEAFEFAKDLTRGFLSDLKSGLEQGKGFWQSFGEAALNVLDKITNKILDDLVNALFEVNAASGGLGGGGFFGLIGKIFGFADGGVAAFGRPQPLKAFARGGVSRTAAIFGEAGPEAAVPLPDGRHIPVKIQNAGRGTGSTDTVRIVLRDDSGRMAEIADQRIQTASGTIVQVSVQQSTKAVKSQMPGMLAEAQARKM